jgi:hypothetical protein
LKSYWYRQTNEQAFAMNCHGVRMSSWGILGKHEIQGKLVTVSAGRKQLRNPSIMCPKSSEIFKKNISFSKLLFDSNYPYVINA